MKISYDPNQFSLTDGRYAAQFIGITPYHNQKAIGADGLPMPPGIKWVFVMASGPDLGKQANRITPAHPTLKNGCGRMIMSITAKDLNADHPFESADYEGNFYMISIREGQMVDVPPPAFFVSRDATPSVLKDAIDCIEGRATETPPAEKKPVKSKK